METQATIRAWALKTFGESNSSLILAARAHKEASELYQIITVVQSQGGSFSTEDFEKFKGELADVLIVLYQVASRENIDLSGQVITVSMNFGHGTLEEVSRKILKEFIYLFERLAAINSNKYYILGAIQNIIYLLNTISNTFGLKLDDLVDTKMIINRQRKWNITGSGIGQHEKDTK